MDDQSWRPQPTVTGDGPVRMRDLHGFHGWVVRVDRDLCKQAGFNCNPQPGQFTVQVDSPADFGPFDFVNSRPATVFACKEDSLGDPSLAGWEMNRAPGLSSVSTQQDGCATFTVNQPGPYTLSETPQAGWTQVTPPNGANFTVEVQSGETYTRTFVNFKNAEITACKELDGTRTPLPGWPIQLGRTRSQERSRRVQTGCVTFIVAASGDYTITEQAQGWTIVAPPGGQFVVKNVQPGDARPGDEPPFTFVNNPNTRVTNPKASSSCRWHIVCVFRRSRGNFSWRRRSRRPSWSPMCCRVTNRSWKPVPAGWALTHFGCSQPRMAALFRRLVPGNTGEFSLGAGQTDHLHSH